MKAIKAFFVAAIMVAIMASCASTKGVGSSLQGSWAITEAVGRSTQGSMKPAEITFGSDGRFNGCAGVNNIFGDYSLRGNALQLSHVGMTRMMGPHMEIENSVVQGINSASSVKVDGDAAVIADAHGTPVLHLKRK